MKEKIIQILERVTDHPGIDDRTDLFAEELLDSLAFIELIPELEAAFGVEIQPTQVPGETWQTADGIAELIETLMRERGRRTGTEQTAPEYYKAYDARYQTIHERGLSWFSGEPTPIVAETIKKYGIGPEARILEIGCGEGRDAAYLLHEGRDVLAADVSPEAIRYCRSRYPGYEDRFTVLDCVRDPHSGSYDFLYAVAVLHMLVKDADRAAFWRFLRDHLVEDGLALVCTMGDGKSEYRSDPDEAFALRERAHESGQILVAATSYRRVSFDSLRREIAAASLEPVKLGLCSGAPDYAELMYAVVRKIGI